MSSVPILLIVFSVGCALSVIIWNTAQDRKWAGLCWVFGISAVTQFVLISTIVIVFLGVQFANAGKISELEAFYDSNLANYKYTADQTEKITIGASESGLADVAYLEVGVVAGDRLRELRDSVALYNDKLARLHKFNENWFADGFLPDAPTRLRPVALIEVPGG